MLAAMPRPSFVLCDALGTLFSFDRAREAFAARGLPTMAFELWYAAAHRDGLALDAAGTFAPFREVAEETLLTLAAEEEWPIDRASATGLVRSLATLAPHPDTRMALDLFARSGVPVAVLTTGGRAATERLFERAHVDGVRHVFTIDDFRHWKPRREVYLGAAHALGLPPPDVALVGVHSFDIHGARQAGLMTGWVRRHEVRRHGAMGPADVEGDSLLEVANALVRLPRGTVVELR
jgi:2-haloacid dehalogenase